MIQDEQWVFFFLRFTSVTFDLIYGWTLNGTWSVYTRSTVDMLQFPLSLPLFQTNLRLPFICNYRQVSRHFLLSSAKAEIHSLPRLGCRTKQKWQQQLSSHVRNWNTTDSTCWFDRANEPVWPRDFERMNRVIRCKHDLSPHRFVQRPDLLHPHLVSPRNVLRIIWSICSIRHFPQWRRIICGKKSDENIWNLYHSVCRTTKRICPSWQ